MNYNTQNTKIRLAISGLPLGKIPAGQQNEARTCGGGFSCVGMAQVRFNVDAPH